MTALDKLRGHAYCMAEDSHIGDIYLGDEKLIRLCARVVVEATDLDEKRIRRVANVLGTEGTNLDDCDIADAMDNFANLLKEKSK